MTGPLASTQMCSWNPTTRDHAQQFLNFQIGTRKDAAGARTLILFSWQASLIMLSRPISYGLLACPFAPTGHTGGEVGWPCLPFVAVTAVCWLTKGWSWFTAGTENPGLLVILVIRFLLGKNKNKTLLFWVTGTGVSWLFLSPSVPFWLVSLLHPHLPHKSFKSKLTGLNENFSF